MIRRRCGTSSSYHGGMLRLGPGVDDKKRRLVVYDKKKMRIIIILSWGDVRMVKLSRINEGRQRITEDILSDKPFKREIRDYRRSPSRRKGEMIIKQAWAVIAASGT